MHDDEAAPICRALGRATIASLLAVGSEGLRQLVFPGLSSWQTSLAAISLSASLLFWLSFWLLCWAIAQLEVFPKNVIEKSCLITGVSRATAG